MSKNIYLKIALFGLLLSFLPANAAAQKKAKSLCQADEQTIWSCALATKNKIASVCASKDLAEDKGYVQFRFGLLGKIEMEIPKERKDSQKAFKYSRYTRPLLTMLTLSFNNNGMYFEIHDDANDEEKPPTRTAWFDFAGSTRPGSFECKKPITGSLMKLEDIVPRNEEN